MMGKKDLFVCAHVWAKEIMEKYSDVDYKTQLTLCMQELIRQQQEKQQQEQN